MIGALAVAAARLAAAGVESPRVDAELLLAHVLGVARSRLVLVDHVPDDMADRFDALVERRAARIPLQHLTGTAPFRHAAVAVGPGVFVPRPETELLVDAVLPPLRAAGNPVAVDLCSGSGALAIALADEVPAARVVAVERPGSAVEWLRRNTAGTRVEVVVADVADPGLLADLNGRADAVVCNPPYVPTSAHVAPEVRHDPTEAVFGGADGLAVIRPAVERAAELLRPGGVLALEHDDAAQSAVLHLLADGPWQVANGHRDLAGRPRYVRAIRTS